MTNHNFVAETHKLLSQLRVCSFLALLLLESYILFLPGRTLTSLSLPLCYGRSQCMFWGTDVSTLLLSVGRFFHIRV